ncbi:MAG TPA: GeoRSP system PqqD family peptide chaperone [Thermodesulfovibrionales bacterium]|nr:GeoRSP system PqqD family peptide chaperone [Thermodesulfovibrionales bacterium]
MKIVRNPDILWREEDESRAEAFAGLARGDDVAEVGTSVLFADGIMLSLNVLGTEIWKRCDGKTVDDIVADLISQFDVEPAVLREDAMTFLDELKKKGFVRYEDE